MAGLTKIKEAYSELLSIAKQASVELGVDVNYPFVPYAPHYVGNYTKEVHILWYGASPNGWFSKDQEEECNPERDARATLLAYQKGRKYWPRTNFWNVMNYVAGYKYKNIDVIDTGKFIWNNIWKLGLQDANSGKPPTRLRRLQLKRCIDLLEMEVDLFNPKVIVFHTGRMADQIVDNQYNWSLAQKVDERLCWTMNGDNRKVIWASRRRGSEKSVQKLIADALTPSA